MKQKSFFAIIAVITALALTALACGGGSAKPTATAAPLATKAPATAAPKATTAPTEKPKATQATATGELAIVLTPTSR